MQVDLKPIEKSYIEGSRPKKLTFLVDLSAKAFNPPPPGLRDMKDFFSVIKTSFFFKQENNENVCKCFPLNKHFLSRQAPPPP